MNDLATITVSLEGEFAKVDSVSVPVDNLAMVGQPWVSSEFAWINGVVVRRKVFRYRARPLLPGAARVGPLVLAAADGQRDTLPAIALQVLRDRVAESNDPEVLLRELQATGRPALFLVAEVDKKNVWVGEQVLVTWWLYNGATVENWQIVGVPKLPEFWSEELDLRAGEAERVFVGDGVMSRVALRRVALYPLRSGSLEIGGMSIEASVMERVRSGPFAMFEGNLVETTFTSAPIGLSVRPLPPGPPVAAVGEVALSCDLPRQQNAGPVVLDVSLTGAANLRSAPAPQFSGRVGGKVEVEGGETSASREDGLFSMTRRWRYLVFPAKSGLLALPPVTLPVFSPALGQRRELRCEATTFWNAVVADSATQAADAENVAEAQRPLRMLPWISGGALVLLFGVLVARRLARELSLRREAHELAQGTPAEIRERVDARLRVAPAALLEERSDRGDAYRALRSLLDAVERDRDIAINANDEIARRVRELLRIVT